MLSLETIFIIVYVCFFKKILDTYRYLVARKTQSEFSFLVNKPLSFLEDVVEKNSDKAYVYGIGVFFAEMVHQYDFDMVPDELVFLINRCRSVSLKFRPSLHDVMKELEQFG